MMVEDLVVTVFDVLVSFLLFGFPWFSVMAGSGWIWLGVLGGGLDIGCLDLGFRCLTSGGDGKVLVVGTSLDSRWLLVVGLLKREK